MQLMVAADIVNCFIVHRLKGEIVKEYLTSEWEEQLMSLNWELYNAYFTIRAAFQNHAYIQR